MIIRTPKTFKLKVLEAVDIILQALNRHEKFTKCGVYINVDEIWWIPVPAYITVTMCVTDVGVDEDRIQVFTEDNNHKVKSIDKGTFFNSFINNESMQNLFFDVVYSEVLNRISARKLKNDTDIQIDRTKFLKYLGVSFR